MLDKVKKYLLPVGTFALTLLTALFWVALRVNYSGISKFLGADKNPSFLVMNLPIMVCVLAWIACAAALVGMLLWHRKKWISVTALVLGVVVTVGAVVVVTGGRSSERSPCGSLPGNRMVSTIPAKTASTANTAIPMYKG